MHMTIYNFVINLPTLLSCFIFMNLKERQDKKRRSTAVEPSRKKCELGTMNIIYMCDSSKAIRMEAVLLPFSLFFTPFTVCHMCKQHSNPSMLPPLAASRTFSYFIMSGNHFLSSDSENGFSWLSGRWCKWQNLSGKFVEPLPMTL